MGYLPRTVDLELDELMADLPAVVLDGPRGVGKTATCSRRATTVLDLDEPSVLQLVAADVSILGSAAGSVFVDEWQRYPPVWDFVRRQVDAGAPAGRYLLAGSSLPVEQPTHSGAGRIVRVRMRPLSLAERMLAPTAVSMTDLLGGGRPPVAGTCEVRLSDYVEEILASGFPAIRSATPRARRALLAGYVTAVVQADFPQQGLRVRRPATLAAWMTAYAAATATTASYNSILDAATSGEGDKPAKTTTIVYRDVLSALWLLDPVPGWLPGRNHINKLTQAPKHHLADPALAAELLGLDGAALMAGAQPGRSVPRDGMLLGHLFESLVTQSVRVYAQAREATVHHLRTQNGLHEVDLVVQRRDHKVVAFEVKLGHQPDASSIRHLLWLREQLGDDLLDAAVITTGEYAYRRPDGIAVIPAALLGP